MSEVSKLSKEQFADYLFNHGGVSLAAIRLITGLSNYKVGLKPVGVDLAPTYGTALISTPEPVTVFERGVKDAGHFKTIEDSAKSILSLEKLKKEAIELGDPRALYAVLNRALIISCRANMNNKPEQARMFSDWLATVLTN